MTEDKDVLPSDAENSGLKPQPPKDETKPELPLEEPKEKADPSKQPS